MVSQSGARSGLIAVEAENFFGRTVSFDDEAISLVVVLEDELIELNAVEPQLFGEHAAHLLGAAGHEADARRFAAARRPPLPNRSLRSLGEGCPNVSAGPPKPDPADLALDHRARPVVRNTL